MDFRKYLPSQTHVKSEHIDTQFQRFAIIIEETFGKVSERTTALWEMYAFLEDRILTAPASSRIIHHNAYVGGYLDHVLNVVGLSEKLFFMYGELGGNPDCTYEEVIFAAMHHDLGKLGDLDGPAYLPVTDAHLNKNGQYFTHNEALQVASCYDRTLFLLNEFGVTYTQNEQLGIKMADGVFSDEAKGLFTSRNLFPHRTNIGYIIHWADWMSANIEKDKVRSIFETNLYKG